MDLLICKKIEPTATHRLSCILTPCTQLPTSSPRTANDVFVPMKTSEEEVYFPGEGCKLYFCTLRSLWWGIPAAFLESFQYIRKWGVWVMSQGRCFSLRWGRNSVLILSQDLFMTKKCIEILRVFNNNTWREFLREMLYKNIAIIAIQHSKIYFVDTFGDISHTVEWNSLKSVWQISLYILAWTPHVEGSNYQTVW